MKRLLIQSLLIIGIHCFGMQTHEYFLDLFKVEPVPTEYKAYQLLTQNPLAAQVNYLAIPWTVLINQKKLDMLPAIRLNGGFSICQHILYERILPYLKQVGINVLFTPHVSRKKVYQGVTVLPFPHVQKYGTDPASQKDIFYSFIGFYSHTVRGPLFSMQHPKNCYVKRRQTWHFWFDQKKQNDFGQEYMDILARSRFSLCPRGTGASTIRFWESLQAGAIPVLLSDEMTLPSEVDWDSAIVSVAEKDVQKIPALLAKITPAQEKQMRANCLKIHKQFSEDNFVSTIRHYYGEA